MINMSQRVGVLLGSRLKIHTLARRVETLQEAMSVYPVGVQHNQSIGL
jgi:EAL domain-containing protein (putative c-di-GMP-specific phosphodiesterase class I)